MSYHNVRDSYGRFSPKKLTGPKKKAKKKTAPKARKIKANASVILNGFLLDSSGSMSGKEAGVIEGFNAIANQSKKDEKKTKVKSKDFVAFFGGDYSRTVSTPGFYKEYSGTCNELKRGKSGSSLTPGVVGYNSDMGGTALWESTALLINKLEAEQKMNPNAKVILTIFTDGGENASSYEWRDGTKIKAVIEAKQKEGWVITFMGAGTREAIYHVASSVGITTSNAINYTNNLAGTRATMDAFSNSKSLYTQAVSRGVSKNVGFFVQEKKTRK